MSYPHKITVKEIPVPEGMIQTVITTDYETHTTTHEFYGTKQEFLEFFKPLVDYYEGVKHEQHRN